MNQTLGYILSFIGGIIVILLYGYIITRKRLFPKNILMKGLFSAIGQSIHIEDYEDDMFGYYYTLFKQYKAAPKSPAGEAAVLQFLYLCYKLFRAYSYSTETIQKIFSGMNNLAKDFPAVNDYMGNEGIKLIAEYQQNISNLNSDFEREFMEFIDSQYA